VSCEEIPDGQGLINKDVQTEIFNRTKVMATARGRRGGPRELTLFGRADNLKRAHWLSWEVLVHGRLPDYVHEHAELALKAAKWRRIAAEAEADVAQPHQSACSSSSAAPAPMDRPPGIECDAWQDNSTQTKPVWDVPGAMAVNVTTCAGCTHRPRRTVHVWFAMKFEHTVLAVIQ
jgi:hypothetical protein